MKLPSNTAFKRYLGTVAALAGLLGATPALAQAPDAFVYRVINGYNREIVGHVRQAPAPATTAQGQVLTVTVDTPALGLARTEIYTPQGQWLRRALDNHGIPVEYDFSAAFPAVQPPFEPGRRWSASVPARVAGESKNRSVRVDGRVRGSERIRVPAGEFDTIKIERAIYAGDADYFISETRIYETDRFAPALGRSVPTETRSSWRDARSGCRRFEPTCDVRGDWHVFELAQLPQP
ncbi:MAG: hypothetical protein FJY56_19320 [Betaproteobacteria bacterium]|nr:hypothetical protein [Betaproteobacteria bacterium]